MTSRARAHRVWHLMAAVAVVVTSAAAATPAIGAPSVAPTPTPSPSAGKSPASKSSPVRWSVAPANATTVDGRNQYSYENVRPGATVHDYVSITNLGAAPVTFRVYAADGVTTADGKISVATAAVKPTDLGVWTKLAHGSVKVPARSQVIEPFTINVPANATPGDHAGGLIASVTEKAAEGQVSRESRFAVAAYVRIVGALTPALGIESVSASYKGTANPFGAGGATVAYTVHNTGNVRLSAAQAVSVTGPFGTEETVRPDALAVVLPGDSVRVTAHLSGIQPVGPLKAHVTVTPGPASHAPKMSAALTPVAQTVGLWATPWPQIVLLLILIVIALGVWWWIRISRRRMRAKLAAAEDRGRQAGALAELLEPAPVRDGDPSDGPELVDSHHAGDATSLAAPDPD
ncbi:DUF916 domain-containing protein [Actinoplanes sp. TBRC 11911]|uniref:WxL protein peptidoglycan domain-containing protein n=1 Tax=Actinoplanes sp. TBRC 11911 TaxID=2729386 RepID=UPI00145F4116|nr:DUF916 domain-containing protein [Actinoplanes sp. TBRC 11911]NMO51199.1 DUF916 domain-containing protein [Actinoplanes sp. TBRC 11911]